MKSIRDAVWNVPCDAVFILVNTDTYGGGGMYNFYAIGTADNERTQHVFVHEFGHSFAGLADEYFSSEVAYQDFYNLKYEPWEPNITTLSTSTANGKTFCQPIHRSLHHWMTLIKTKPAYLKVAAIFRKGFTARWIIGMMRDYALLSGHAAVQSCE